eukprot:5175192-Pleurochrysis_carterae.AAC.4
MGQTKEPAACALQLRVVPTDHPPVVGKWTEGRTRREGAWLLIGGLQTQSQDAASHVHSEQEVSVGVREKKR